MLVCGGDGSAAWTLSAIKEAELKAWDGSSYRPAVALLPLGTGNDLARVFGWGKGVRLGACGRESNPRLTSPSLARESAALTCMLTFASRALSQTRSARASPRSAYRLTRV